MNPNDPATREAAARLMLEAAAAGDWETMDKLQALIAPDQPVQPLT